MELNNSFLKAYKAWLLTWNDLRDCAYITDANGRDKFRSSELEDFRNVPKLTYAERHLPHFKRPVHLYRGAYHPTYDDLAAHLITQRNRTIFATNGAQAKSLMLLVDIDNKTGHADADGAAQLLITKYLAGNGIAQQSTYGLGRHIYFLLNVDFIPRRMVRGCLERLSMTIKADRSFESFGVTFDNVIYGLPTIWKINGGRSVIEVRGNELKLPFMDEVDITLNEFKALTPIRYSFLNDLVMKSASSKCHTYISSSLTVDSPPIRQNTIGLRWNTDDYDGKIRRTACVSYNMISTDGQTSPEAILADYHEFYNPTGMAASDIRKRIKDITRLFRKFSVSFQPANGSNNPDAHPFEKDEYLPLVESLVPPLSLSRPHHSSQRDSLTHEKLSDFVSIKVQDAFFDKESNEWFGRASRDATINNMRSLKSKGIVSWIANNHSYKRLLDLSVRYQLLYVYMAHVPPTFGPEQMKIIKKHGRARLIGPGPALRSEYERFQSIMKRRGLRINDSKAA